MQYVCAILQYVACLSVCTVFPKNISQTAGTNMNNKIAKYKTYPVFFFLQLLSETFLTQIRILQDSLVYVRI